MIGFQMWISHTLLGLISIPLPGRYSVLNPLILLYFILPKSLSKQLQHLVLLSS